MSAVSHTQVNNKKGAQQQQNGSSAGAGSVSGSAGSTPAQTPNGNMAPQQQQVPPPSQSTSPPANNAPKYGTLVPNRVFVGGISANTTEGELAQLFSAYGTVKATKIISDRAGVSKGYGFVTFESEEEARRLQRESDNIMLRERRLNIAPAIKKQPFNRSFDVPSPPPNAATPAQYYYAAAAAAAAGGAVPYAYQNGMTYYATPPQTTANGADHNTAAQQPVYQPPPVYATQTAAPQAAPYPMPMYPPQPLFVHQQYPYQPIPYDPQQFYGAGGQGLGGPAQYMYSGGGGSNGGGGSVAASGPQQQQSTGGNGSGASGSATAPSPTRHHHQQQHPPPPPTGYYQQFTYNTSDGMYYNVPLFTIDPSAGVYSEGVDASLTGMTEASHPPVMDHSLSGAQTPVMPTSATPPGGPLPSTGALPKHHQHHLGQQQQQSYVPYNCVIPVSERNGYNSQSQSDKTTPVVSLLSVGQANERDYRSMQGGRKHRPGPGSGPGVGVGADKQQQDMSSGNVNGIQPFRMTGQSMNYMYTPVNGYMSNKLYRKTDKCDSNQCRSWSKKRRNYSNCNTESSSISSVRTSSNSSANAVFDENLNEKKDKSNECSPPPASYSPMTIQNSQLAHDNSRHVFQNPMSNTGSSYYHGGGGNNSARRNRRNNPRRNNHAHGQQHYQSHHQQQHHQHQPQQQQQQQHHHQQQQQQQQQQQLQLQPEIGAGDAPLPSTEVTVNDVCKKIDSIKL